MKCCKNIIGSFTFVLLMLLLSMQVRAQNQSTFSYDQFISQILNHHPIVKQANLNLERAKSNLLFSKGVLDPTLSATFNEKNYQEKLYFRQLQGEFRIPTPIGVDIATGYEKNSGVFLNPEEFTPGSGLWNVGIEVDLIQGLLVNERSTTLKQAQTFNKLAENEQNIVLNDIIYQASLAYLSWQKYSLIQVVTRENRALAIAYFGNTKQSFLGGEKTAIDTLEAYLMLQDAIVDLNTNSGKLTKSQQVIENFLWLNEAPVGLLDEIVPDTLSILDEFVANTTNIQGLINQHPLLLKAKNKKEFEELELRLKQEKLKPKLKAKYNPLLETDNTNPTFSTSNFKWGLDFSYPIFIRIERGAVELQKIKIYDIDYEIDNKRNLLINKAENSIAQLEILNDQIELQTLNYQGYKKLLDAEKIRFSLGESSVFLVNKRQEKYIQAEIKLIELNVKRQIEQLNYLYFTNQLIDR